MCDITLSHQPFDVHARNGNLKLSIVQCLRNKNQERTASFGGQSRSEAWDKNSAEGIRGLGLYSREHVTFPAGPCCQSMKSWMAVFVTAIDQTSPSANG